MARRKISIDEKIERAEGAVSRAKEKYDAALEELKRLHEKKEELQRAEMMEAVLKSKKSHEEIMAFLSS